MLALLKLFLLPLTLSKTSGASAEDDVAVADPDDPGYQASYSKLGASEGVRPDPVAHVPEPRTYLATSLVATSQTHQGQIHPLVLAAGPEFATPFLTYLSANSFVLL